MPLHIVRNTTDELVEAILRFEQWSKCPDLQEEFRAMYRKEVEQARSEFIGCPKRDHDICRVISGFRGAGGTYQYYVDNKGNLCLSTYRAYGREAEATRLGLGLW